MRNFNFYLLIILLGQINCSQPRLINSGLETSEGIQTSSLANEGINPELITKLSTEIEKGILFAYCKSKKNINLNE
jgi:hypothetical protein